MLTVSAVSKRFAGVQANHAIGCAVRAGEIHALLGENGAGKSTLVKIVYGVLQPDQGTMALDGKAYAPANPAEARRHGVGMVFQHFQLFDALTVGENIALSLDQPAARRDLDARIREVSATYGLALDIGRTVGTLSVGERQRVEIVRCLLQRPRLLIMDEPTSVLTPQECSTLFATLRQLADEGCSILYISHKLEDVRALCTTATVLRGGRVVATCDPRRESAHSLAEMMIGRDLVPANGRAASVGRIRLRVRGLQLVREHPFGVDLKGIGFDVREGEILGIAGVAGNGQSELMDALSGERTAATSGEVMLDGKPIGRKSPSDRRTAGLVTIPEDRLGHGAVSSLTLWENVLLSARRRMGLDVRGFVRADRSRQYAGKVIGDFAVKATGVKQSAGTLSGGNLQKFLVGREILQEPAVLVASQPTWGVDAGAEADIHRALQALAARGTAIVVISQDLDELMALADRIAVIAHGTLSEPAPVHAVTVAQIGLLMGGAASGTVVDAEAQGGAHDPA